MALTTDEQKVVDHWQAYGEGSNPDEQFTKGRLCSFRGLLYHAPEGPESAKHGEGEDSTLVAVGSGQKQLLNDEDSAAPPEFIAEVREYLLPARPAPARTSASVESGSSSRSRSGGSGT